MEIKKGTLVAIIDFPDPLTGDPRIGEKEDLLGIVCRPCPGKKWVFWTTRYAFQDCDEENLVPLAQLDQSELTEILPEPEEALIGITLSLARQIYETRKRASETARNLVLSSQSEIERPRLS